MSIEPIVIPAPEATSGPTIPNVTIGNGLQNFKGLDLSFFSWAGILAFLSTLWSFYTILAYILSIILLVLYVYASIRKNMYVEIQTQALRDAEKLYDLKYGSAQKSSRLHDVFKHAESDNPNDWKLAIIEADIVLDQALKDRGYLGDSLGSRLKNMSSAQLNSIQDAWEAHKIRNRIAHDGADFVLTKHVARETIARYQRVFSELGVV